MNKHTSKLFPKKTSKTNFHFRPSFPVIVSVSPAKTPNRRVPSPTILRKTHSSLNSITSSFNHIHPTIFKDLIHQYGINTINSITQCVLDLTLIVSVHSSLPNLHESNEEYQKKYQEIIDNESITASKTCIEPDILTFYQIIKQNKANIRNAQCK
jgi:hypothetical protein